METHPENTLQRFKTFWLALGLMVAFAVVGLAVRAWKSPKEEFTSGADTKRLATLTEVRDAQAKAVTALGLVHHDPQGGHLTSVTVPDALIKKSLEHLQGAAKAAAAQGNKTEQLIPGSKTFMDQQSKKHDPTESEFLKK